ncbi:MAG: MupG family TIM beta-alpha barrel fold protein [Acidaminococcus sp.]|jgi:hypothetical protein|nr:MupG family TIM beta-alpha barrel fold protein [Acidaminococcus sp.]MCI2115537.1 MupG family TIM beta-alpha barrel fold protein [Acidaminococcus sp.]MCI2117662.1 MupG family TIM beta-alpha barrel fold protein [Acidaminococcus sp.]
MEKGISLYPGMGMSQKTCLQRLRDAAARGVKRLFLSLHLPEADKEAFAREVQPLLAEAEKLGMKTIGDMVPGSEIPEGITHLRLDDGFTLQDIAALQQKYADRTLVLNASAIDEETLEELVKAGADFSRMEALHNFYPRPHTGVSEAYFASQNAMLHAYGLTVGAFVPSATGRRGPLHAGLPTLELNRRMSLKLALNHLLLLGTDVIYIGDDGPSESELQLLAATDGVVNLTMLTDRITPLHKKLASHVYTCRPDLSEEVIRAADSRAQWKDTDIQPFSKHQLTAGSVTLDNKLAGRYAGEVEICLTDLPAVESVNRMGVIPFKEMFLLPLFHGGVKFRFVPKVVGK